MASFNLTNAPTHDQMIIAYWKELQQISDKIDNLIDQREASKDPCVEVAVVATCAKLHERQKMIYSSMSILSAESNYAASIQLSIIYQLIHNDELDKQIYSRLISSITNSMISSGVTECNRWIEDGCLPQPFMVSHEEDLEEVA